MDSAMNVASQSQAPGGLSHWVQLAQEGDTKAFEQVVKLTEGLSRKIAFSILGHQGLEDALQESYLLVYQKLRQLKDPAAFTGWLSRLVLHVSYKLKKQNRGENELPQELVGDAQPADEEMVNSLALRQALGRLQQKDRDVLILRELLGLSYEEIGHALGLPVGTVRSRLFSARKNLESRWKL